MATPKRHHRQQQRSLHHTHAVTSIAAFLRHGHINLSTATCAGRGIVRPPGKVPPQHGGGQSGAWKLMRSYHTYKLAIGFHTEIFANAYFWYTSKTCPKAAWCFLAKLPMVAAMIGFIGGRRHWEGTTPTGEMWCNAAAPGKKWGRSKVGSLGFEVLISPCNTMVDGIPYSKHGGLYLVGKWFHCFPSSNDWFQQRLEFQTKIDQLHGFFWYLNCQPFRPSRRWS